MEYKERQSYQIVHGVGSNLYIRGKGPIFWRTFLSPHLIRWPAYVSAEAATSAADLYMSAVLSLSFWEWFWADIMKRSVTKRVTDGDDINAASTSSHRLTPRCRRIVRVAVRHNHQVVGHVWPVSVARLKHHVSREPVKNNQMHTCKIHANKVSP